MSLFLAVTFLQTHKESVSLSCNDRREEVKVATKNILLADRTIGRAFGTVVSRLSVVCLSVVCPSVTFCIVAKRYVLAKNFLKE